MEVEFEGFDVYDTEPGSMPDVFAQRPLVLVGKYRGRPEGEIIVRGKAAGQTYEGRIRVEDALESEDNRALRTLWARRRLMAISDDVVLEEDEEGKAEIIRLGLKYGLLSKYTSFIAVDKQVRSDGRTIKKVRQPLPLPLEVNELAVGIGSGGFFGGLGTPPGSVGKTPPAMVLGSLDGRTIKSTIAKNRLKIQACYKRALKSDPSLQGKIVVTFTIGPKGTVTSARITKESSISDVVMIEDILRVIRRMKFPVPPGGASITVSYPFLFRSI